MGSCPSLASCGTPSHRGVRCRVSPLATAELMGRAAIQVVAAVPNAETSGGASGHLGSQILTHHQRAAAHWPLGTRKRGVLTYTCLSGQRGTWQVPDVLLQGDRGRRRALESVDDTSRFNPSFSTLHLVLHYNYRLPRIAANGSSLSKAPRIARVHNCQHHGPLGPSI